ncbi:MAG: serine/threonine-protein kinase [Labilithrix sp.]
MDAPGAVTIGEVVAGRYRVDGVLGEGGMGAVYDVVDVTTGQPLALKVVLDANADHVKRFEREGKATMRIESEHVVRVIDVGSIDGKVPFMVMERLEGDTLKALVEQAPLDERTVADLMLQACEGLAHAHALGIVHRDVKPSNLFVLDGPPPRELKVLDFGISRMTTYEAYENQGKTETVTVTDSAQLLGSPQYTSPEQLQNPSGVDERADIWSLGVSMYYALTRQLPFAGSSLADVLVAVMSKPIPPLGARASAAMTAVVQKCLTRSLDERFRRVSDLAAALAPLASPSRAALLPRIQQVAGQAELIVAPVPPSKLRDPDDKTLTFDTDSDQKATVADLRSQRPPRLDPVTTPASPEPVTAPAVMVTPPRRARPQPILGLAFALGLSATIVAGAFVLKSFREVPPEPATSAAPAPAPAPAPPPEPSVVAEPEPESTDPKLELVADAPIAKVIRPAYRRFAIEDGRALVTVAPFKGELPIEVELASGARAKGAAKAGGPTMIKLTTAKTSKGPLPKPPAKPSSDGELHKSPYQ